MPKTRLVFQEVYRQLKTPTRLQYNVGSVKDIEPGDLCTFISEEGKFTTRTIAKVTPSQLEMEKPRWAPEPRPLSVLYKHVHEVIRQIGEEPAEEDGLLPIERRRNPDGSRKGLNRMRPELAAKAKTRKVSDVVPPPKPVVEETPALGEEPKQPRKSPRPERAAPAFSILDLIPAPGDGKPKG